MKRLRSGLLLAMLVAVLAGCGAAATPTAAPTPLPPAAPTKAAAATAGDLTVFAAASLTDAFTEIGNNFGAANGGVKVIFSFAGSNALAAQIGQGAPTDVFASANDAQMAVAVKTGRINADTPRVFARNRLVLIVAKGVSKVTKLQDLATPGLKVVLADKAVPVGQYALDYMDKAGNDPSFTPGYKAAVLKNVVSYEQDVKAVLAKVALGEADAGIVYTTDVLGANATKVQKVDIPDTLNTIANYPIAVLADSKIVALAKKFFDYILSTDGQTVLAKYGFIPITGISTSLAVGKGTVASLMRYTFSEEGAP